MNNMKALLKTKGTKVVFSGFVRALLIEDHAFGIWRLDSHELAVNWKNNYNETRTHNHLVRKQTPNHLAKMANLAKWLSFRLRTKWLWVLVPLQSLKLQISRLLRARSSLTFKQL